MSIALATTPAAAVPPLRATAAAPAQSIREAAVAFEGMFIHTLLETASSGLKTDGPFGGGSAERSWRSLQNEQYGKAIAARGGVGLADAIERMMLRLQEAQPAGGAP